MKSKLNLQEHFIVHGGKFLISTIFLISMTSCMNHVLMIHAEDNKASESVIENELFSIYMYGESLQTSLNNRMELLINVKPKKSFWFDVKNTKIKKIKDNSIIKFIARESIEYEFKDISKSKIFIDTERSIYFYFDIKIKKTEQQILVEPFPIKIEFPFIAIGCDTIKIPKLQFKARLSKSVIFP